MKIHAILLAALLLLLNSCASNAQLLKDAKKLLGKQNVSLTESDAAEGIREALIKGTGEGVAMVSVLDGYFGNPEIRIPFPPEAKNIETRLRAIGLGNKVDEAVLSINRAAEAAAIEAKPIFIAAIRGMTIRDAIGIVKGADNAATEYLQRTTTGELHTKFEPVIKSSLDKVNATKYWADLITAYNKIPLVEKMNPDLTDYVTGMAIDGLFVMVAKEELKIRKDPMARTTDLLKKVFGN